MDESTKCKGDNDPIDVCEIGQKVVIVLFLPFCEQYLFVFRYEHLFLNIIEDKIHSNKKI